MPPVSASQQASPILAPPSSQAPNAHRIPVAVEELPLNKPPQTERVAVAARVSPLPALGSAINGSSLRAARPGC